jgi:hypothetical protein
MSAGNAYIAISNAEAKRLRKRFETEGKRGLFPVSTDPETGGTPRAFYINLDQAVALEPIES